MVMTPAQHGQIMDGLRHIAKQQARVIALLETGAVTTKTAGLLSDFQSRISKEFSKLLASDISRWIMGNLLWIAGAAGLGLLHWFGKVLGFSM